MKTYKYSLFLRNPETGEYKVQVIEVDNEGFMDLNTLIENRNCNPEQFDSGFTLVGVDVCLVINVEE